MCDVVVLVPVRSVAQWITDLLKSYGHRPAIATSIAELARLLCFIRFDAVLAWLPSHDLNALAGTLQMQHPSRPSLLILSFTSAEFSTTPSWFRKDRDRVIRLPVSSAALLSTVGGAFPLELADESHTAVRPTPDPLVTILP